MPFGKDLAPGMLHGHRAHQEAVARISWCVSEQAIGVITGECGASVFWRAAGRGTVSIAAGTLDPPTGLTTIAQIYVAARGDYYELAGEGERHPAGLDPPAS